MNKYNNVQMWVALDNVGQQIFIEGAKIGQDYICPECGGIVRARAKDSDYMTEHFYHLNKSNCSGESLLHIYWKNNLIKIGETITLPIVGTVTCIDKRVEFAFNTNEGKYQPDLIIKTDNEKYKFIIIEIHNTNPKIIEDYQNKWDELKYTVFEIDVKGLDKDKSNLNKRLKLLYSPQKEIFIRNSKVFLDDLLDKVNEGMKKNDEYYYEFTIEGLPEHYKKMIGLGIAKLEDFKPRISYKNKGYESLKKLINLIYYFIAGEHIDTYTHFKSEKVLENIRYLYANKNVDNNLVKPLYKIHKELENYII